VLLRTTSRRFDGIVESGDNTMVCTKQFCSYRDRAEDFAALPATVVGISSRSLDSHEAFVAKHGLNVPLLADTDKQVAKT
jgi:thioredoxin-dependent peroxiredoxin